MPIFVRHCHLLHNILDILISYFYSSIHLRPDGRRVVVLCLELLAELSDHLVVKIGTIVCNDPFRDAVSIDQVMPNESCYDVLGYRSIGSCSTHFVK